MDTRRIAAISVRNRIAQPARAEPRTAPAPRRRCSRQFPTGRPSLCQIPPSNGDILPAPAFPAGARNSIHCVQGRSFARTSNVASMHACGEMHRNAVYARMSAHLDRRAGEGNHHFLQSNGFKAHTSKVHRHKTESPAAVNKQPSKILLFQYLRIILNCKYPVIGRQKIVILHSFFPDHAGQAMGKRDAPPHQSGFRKSNAWSRHQEAGSPFNHFLILQPEIAIHICISVTSLGYFQSFVSRTDLYTRTTYHVRFK